VVEKLRYCDVLIHPSLHDSGGWVCLEAMATGRPVICFDLGGPALQVTPETGIKVPALSPEQAVHDLDVAMERLACDSGLRSRMALAGRRRVREQFNWELKGKQLASLYNEVVNPHVAGDPRLVKG
jgi:glycosyltransferase involved in cell wall biosynthesis